MDFEREILQRLQRIETLQEAMEERNAAEHQEIISSIKELRKNDSQSAQLNGTQNERLAELETAFTAHVEEETKDRNSYMWRFGLMVTVAIFLANLVTLFLH